ncbi:alpha/beta hydrolase [Amycolatopsis sp. H20-H5]|uniref:alpha/beta hydrolase n=1 Tax=Amycolatopsis sp. H20-H5 TaxID=3046309 RepID=UPI002DBE7357|nr:alpha/beta hydrolase family protein [Amycolatopsis sp. H20-H5]MEC3982659.1 alpha/beta hydrolase family protein [Amycolatopsis sp. H20-H5]
MNFVFVPGVNHGGWCWHPVGQRVRAAGHAVYALTLPGLAMGDDPSGLRLTDAVDHIVGEVERRDLHDVVLVGHSFAGIPISGAAPRILGRLAHVAFLSAFIPRRGESMAAALGPDTAAWMQSMVHASPDDTIDIDFETFSTRLMQDEPVELQKLVFDQLTPQPGGYVLDSLDVDGLDTLGVPMAYLLAERDIALAASGIELAGRLGLEPIMVPGTHEAMLTHPDDVAKALLTSTGG